MIKKELFTFIKKDKKWLYFELLSRYLSLLMQIFIISQIVLLIEDGLFRELNSDEIIYKVSLILVAMLVKKMSEGIESKFSYEFSKNVRKNIRNEIFSKLAILGDGYKKYISTAQLSQLSVEGVEQIEIYFSKYIPQLIYSVSAPFILFIYLAFYDLKSAALLLLFVPLIPISIVLIQKVAKRLLKKYWDSYVGLGDLFLDSLLGLNELKIFGSDSIRQKKIDEQSESFRKRTMKVLLMQLNSVSMMDFIALAGAGVGIASSLNNFKNGNIELYVVLTVILLSAEFFIPVRLLGSYFHIAMNGMSASDRIFKFLRGDLESDYLMGNIDSILKSLEINNAIDIENLSFNYKNQRNIKNNDNEKSNKISINDKETFEIKNLNMNIKRGEFVSIIGLSGSGKSTIAKIISGMEKNFKGTLKILGDCSFNNVSYIGSTSRLFKGSLRYNLTFSEDKKDDEKLITILKMLSLNNLDSDEENNRNDKEILEKIIEEDGNNLSCGQKQRIYLARALFMDKEIIILDEVTSGLDKENENKVIDLINSLKKRGKTVISITHRLVSAKNSDQIFFMDKGVLLYSGTHEELFDKCIKYKDLFLAQQSIEEVS